MNVIWYSDPWPVTGTSQPIRLSTNFITFVPSLTLTKLRVVSMVNSQAGYAYPSDTWFRPLGGGGLAYALIVETSFPESTPMLWPWYRTWPSPNYETFPLGICDGCGKPAGALTHLSGHLVPFSFRDLPMFQLLIPVFPNLPCLFSTFHLEYPTILSRVCLKGVTNIFLWNNPIAGHMFNMFIKHFLVMYFIAYDTCSGKLIWMCLRFGGMHASERT